MRQQSLFALREIPEGLLFKPDFLTVQEKRGLFALLRTLPFYEFTLHGVAAKRRVLHYGLRYALESHMLSTALKFPVTLNQFGVAPQSSPAWPLMTSRKF
jgi:hypothetical protein